MERLSLPLLGIDLVYMPRFKDKVEDKRWLQRILTPKEQAILEKCQSPKRRLAFLCGRYAAKEAYAKAVGQGIGSLDFLDIEILKDDKGRPISPLMTVSISHDQDYAVAVVYATL